MYTNVSTSNSDVHSPYYLIQHFINMGEKENSKKVIKKITRQESKTIHISKTADPVWKCPEKKTLKISKNMPQPRRIIAAKKGKTITKRAYSRTVSGSVIFSIIIFSVTVLFLQPVAFGAENKLLDFPIRSISPDNLSVTIDDEQKILLDNLTLDANLTNKIQNSILDLTDISCIGRDVLVDFSTFDASIDLEENEYVICVFNSSTEDDVEPLLVIKKNGVLYESSTNKHEDKFLSNLQSQTSDNLTDDNKEIQVNEQLTRPTFGLNHETFKTIVKNGFRLNDRSFTITDNFHTPFAQQTIHVNEANTFEAKLYAEKKLHVQEFLFGIPNTGQAHLAELGVEVWYGLNGDIQDVKVIQKSNIIDKNTLIATHEKSKCKSSDTEEKCDTTKIFMVFLEPLKDPVMAIKAIDYKNRYQITYLNEGVLIAGDSLNPMNIAMIPSNLRDQGLLKVTQLEKYSPFWQSDDGRMFEMNSFGSYKEINQTFERFHDTGVAKTRLHSEFGQLMVSEQKRAVDVFDATKLISELPESFAYVLPERGERLTVDMKTKMLDQENIAKKVLEEFKVPTRW